MDSAQLYNTYKNLGFRNIIIIHKRGMISGSKIQIQLKFHIDPGKITF